MTVAGIDFNTHRVDIVCLHETKPPEWDGFELPRAALAFDRARHARSCLPTASWWENRGVYLVGIEAPMSRHVQSAAPLSRTQGVIIATIPPGITVVETPPAEWLRKLVGDEKGIPRASEDRKRLARVEAQNRGAPYHWSTDAYDAFGIAWAVRELNEHALTLTS